jgi:hypothetical protein
MMPGELELVRVVDETGAFAQSDYDELLEFIEGDLLSSHPDIFFLDVIRIRSDIRANYSGYWTARFHYDPNNETRVVGVVAVIVLNYFYLKTLDSLKTTLAHEYGHHWTLTYMAIARGVYDQQRLPADYYQLRNLDPLSYTHDYTMGWNRCDREVIAEDYRVLFAPDPHNSAHKMVTHVSMPDENVERYIADLGKSIPEWRSI